METEKTLIIGVTGHRNLRPEDRERLHRAVLGELERLRGRGSAVSLRMLNSLAEGGDQLCAQAARELGIPVDPVLPLPMEDYLADFAPAGAALMKDFCGRSPAVSPFFEPEPEGGADRDFCYRQAGIYVSTRSHILLALWDGLPSPAAPCGAAAAVGFALETGRQGARNWGAVIHVLTPRGEQDPAGAGTVRYLGNWKAAEERLREGRIGP